MKVFADRRGFTVVELFLVIAISLVLVLASLPIYNSLQVKAQIGESTAQLVQNLRIVKQNAKARYQNASGYGVYLDLNGVPNNSYTVYQGTSYTLRNSAYDLTTVLDNAVKIENIDLVLTAGDIDINFSAGIGQPNNTGSFKLKHAVQGEKIININSEGKIE